MTTTGTISALVAVAAALVYANFSDHRRVSEPARLIFAAAFLALLISLADQHLRLSR